MQLRGAPSAGLRAEALARFNAGIRPEAVSAAAATAKEHHDRLFESLRVLVCSMADTSPSPAQCARVAECLGHLATLDVSSPRSLVAAAAPAAPPTPGNRAPAVAAFKASDSDSDEAAPVSTPNRSGAQHLASLGTAPSSSVPTAAAAATEEGRGDDDKGAAAPPAALAPVFYDAARAFFDREDSPASSDIAHLLADGRPPVFVVAGAAAAGDNISCAAGAARRVAGAAGVEVDDDCASS